MIGAHKIFAKEKMFGSPVIFPPTHETPWKANLNKSAHRPQKKVAKRLMEAQSET